ncbi:MAG: YggS family pyridoxal phosphate-dependent enzyme [Prolixibacteraceae bacterium]|nr:YggS family pyridoxal phosphate-dependent enzyme [Prolixibacteraceae bacterium]
MDIAKNLEKIKSDLPEGVKLVAVSKTKPNDAILEAYQTGHRIFGENKAQELIRKQPELPNDIEWHFIGHLQSNKTKYIAPFVSMIHSIDSFKILKTINKEARKNNRVIPCLLQFHIAEEESKYGLTENDAREILESEACKNMQNVSIKGIMGMATFTDDSEKVRSEFRRLKAIFKNIKEAYFTDDPEFREISMGMSDDYELALEEGSTIVRIGSKIFGERNYG